MLIEDLLELVSPPKKPFEVGPRKDWKKFEKELGTELPADYRELIFHYGTGSFSNEGNPYGFVYLYNPFSGNENLELTYQVRIECDTYRELNELEDPEENAFPFAIYPNSPGLLPFGRDAANNVFNWLTTGEPEEWTTIVTCPEDGEYQQFVFPLTTFLVKAFKGEITCDMWPDDFPEPGRKFVFIPSGPPRS